MLLINMYVIKYCLFLNYLILIFCKDTKNKISYYNNDKKHLTL